MQFVVENSPSPGAKFTDNTKNSIIAYYEICEKYPSRISSFAEYRDTVTKEKKTNPQNDRNIFPFLRNLGFVKYGKDDIRYGDLFTQRGNALVKTLRAQKIFKVNEDDLSEEQRKSVNEKLQSMLEELISFGLWQAIKDKSGSMTYRDALLQTLRFLLDFNNYDKKEFAYMVYCNANDCYDIKKMAQILSEYRSGDLEFEIKVDIYDKKSGSALNRKLDGLEKLTCYTYITGLLEAAGIVHKIGKRYSMVEKKREFIMDCVKGA